MDYTKILNPAEAIDLNSHEERLTASREVVKKAKSNGSKAIFLMDRKARLLAPYINRALSEKDHKDKIPIIFINPAIALIEGVNSADVVASYRATQLWGRFREYLKYGTRSENGTDTDQELLEEFLKSIGIDINTIPRSSSSNVDANAIIPEEEFKEKSKQFFIDNQQLLYAYDSLDDFLKQNKKRIESLAEITGMPLPNSLDNTDVTVVDLCAHSGISLEVVRNFMLLLGFKPQAGLISVDPKCPSEYFDYGLYLDLVMSGCGMRVSFTHGFAKTAKGAISTNGYPDALASFRAERRATHKFLKSSGI